jgi:hypothetical protein
VQQDATIQDMYKVSRFICVQANGQRLHDQIIMLLSVGFISSSGSLHLYSITHFASFYVFFLSICSSIHFFSFTSSFSLIFYDFGSTQLL